MRDIFPSGGSLHGNRLGGFKTVNGKEACVTAVTVILTTGEQMVSFKTVNGKEACVTSDKVKE